MESIKNPFAVYLVSRHARAIAKAKKQLGPAPDGTSIQDIIGFDPNGQRHSL